MRYACLTAAAITCVGIAITVVCAGEVRAQDAAATVKERKEMMAKMWPSFYQSFAQVARGQSTDVAAIPAKAQDAAAAVRKVATLFPPGTSRDAVATTRAKPEVWSEKADFDAAMTKLAVETEKLGDAAKSGSVDAVKAQWTVVAQACGGCHGGPKDSGGKFRFPEQ